VATGSRVASSARRAPQTGFAGKEFALSSTTGTSAACFTGPAILGIKQISRQSEFGSSYTLINMLRKEWLQFELKTVGANESRRMRKDMDEETTSAVRK